jgi:hypothetical protein
MLVISFVALSNAPDAHAQGKFDGRWSAVVVTKSGTCQQSYRGAVYVSNGTVQVEGANGALYGRVLPNGSVTATGSMGGNYGAAWGRLSGNSGGGRWRVHMQTGNCSGVWTVQRRSGV